MANNKNTAIAYQRLPIAPETFHPWVDAEISALLASRPRGYSRFGNFEAFTMFGIFDRAALNALTKKHTGFTSFHSMLIDKKFFLFFDLVTAHGADYIDFTVLYQAYNIAQEARGDERRAHVWRGWPGR